MPLVRERPVAELGRVGRGVDVRHRAVGQGDLVDSFVEVSHAFEAGAALGRGPEVAGGFDAQVGGVGG